MFKTKKALIKDLKQQVASLQEVYEKSNDDRKELIEANLQLKKKIEQKDNEIAELIHVQNENKILKKYYHMDQEPSPEIQAKVLADLRVHEIEYEYTQKRIEELKCKIEQMSFETGIPRYFFKLGDE